MTVHDVNVGGLFRWVGRESDHPRTQQLMRAFDKHQIRELVDLGVLRPEVPTTISRTAVMELFRITIARGEALGYADDDLRDALADLEDAERGRAR